MKEIENIDRIIEQGLSDFNPPAPPDAWDAISQQLANGTVPNTQGEGASTGANGQAASGLWQGIQNLSLAAKLVVAVVSVGLGIGVYTWVTDRPKEILSPASSSEVSKALRSEPSNAIGNGGEEHSESEILLEEKEKGEKNTGLAKLRKQETVTARPLVQNKELDNGAKQDLNVTLDHPKTEASLPNKDKIESHATFKKEEHESSTEPDQGTGLHEKVEGENANMADGEGPNRSEPEFGNAFSPNGDGTNDTWEIRMEKTLYFRLLVYDRKGLLVYESDQTEKYWNGTNYKTGVDCEAGSYSYVIEYQFDKAEKLKVKRGIINLLR